MKQLNLQLHTKMQVRVATPVSGLSQIEPAQLTQQNSHLHDALEIINMTKDRTIELSIRSFP